MKPVTQFRWKVLLLAIVAAPALLLAQDAKSSSRQEIYKTKCAMCHGDDGTAKTALGEQMKASDLRSLQVEKQSDADLKEVVAHGKNSMPSFSEQLSSDEITQVLSYVRQLGKKGKAVAPHH